LSHVLGYFSSSISFLVLPSLGPWSAYLCLPVLEVTVLCHHTSLVGWNGILFFKNFYFWWDWGLNSGLHTCQVGCLPLELYLKSTVVCLITFCLGLHHAAILSISAFHIAGIPHRCEPQHPASTHTTLNIVLSDLSHIILHFCMYSPSMFSHLTEESQILVVMYRALHSLLLPWCFLFRTLYFPCITQP
jgi:hypothetical protein